MNSLSRQVRNVRRVGGFTLVEVLVSIVVLSFGLLGMVGLQAASLQANRDARLQSTAVVLARELAEMMRGNKDEALRSTNNPYLIGRVNSPLAAPTPTYCLSVGGTACTTPGAVAQAELTDWLARVEDALPKATISICRDTAPFAPDGTAQWACTSTNNSDPILIKIGWTRPSFKSGDDVVQASDHPSVVLPVTPGSTL